MAKFSIDWGLEEPVSNDDCELKSCQSFLSDFVDKFNKQTIVNFSTELLRNHFITADDRWVLLYLHKTNDQFSSNFCRHLCESNVEDILGDSSIFTVIAWDISAGGASTKDSLKKTITSILGNHFADYVSSNKSVALLIDNSRKVIRSCEDDNSLASFTDILKNIQEIAHKNNGDNKFDLNEEINSTNFQQRMFDLLGDRDYDSFEQNQHPLLRCKIGYHLYGPPDVQPVGKETDVSILEGIYSYEGAEDNITKLLKKIVDENNKYCKWNGRVVISFIYVCAEPLAKEKQRRKLKDEKYNPDSDYTRMPLFVLRKCKGKSDGGPFCRLIIDVGCRVYRSWDDYLKNNKLPPCLMVCPYQGKYQSFENNSDVALEEHFSPCTSISKKVLNAADVGLGIAGLAAGGIVMITATPLIVLGATITGIGSGIYAAARGAHTLTDRHQHGEDINLRNGDSRAAIITIVGSTLTLGMMGSVQVVAYLAENGVALGQGTRLLLYGLSATTLGINGVGIGNTIYQMILDGERPTTLQILQLGASIFFFGNSLYNFRSVGTVIDKSQAKALSEIESTLSSNRMRKVFNKMLKETMRLEGNTAGKAEVISAMRNMDNPHEVIRILNRNNKNLNNAGVRFSVQDGNVLLNGQKVDIMDVSRMSSYERGSFLKNMPPIPDNVTPNVSYSINAEFNSFIQENRKLLITSTVLLTTGNTAAFVREVLSAFNPLMRKFIYKLTELFMEDLSKQRIIIDEVANLFPDTDLFLLILRWICNTLGGVPAFEKISNEQRWNNDDINMVLEELMRRFLTWFSDLLYDQGSRENRRAIRRENNREKEKKMCKDCRGYFYS